MTAILTLDDIRHETRFVVHVEARDQPKRIAAGALMMGICYWGSADAKIFVLAVVILLTEVLSHYLGRRLPERDDDLNLKWMCAVWTNNIVSTVLYLLPAVILAGENSAALLLAGFLWLCGCIVHMANTFAYLPFYNWSMIVVGFAMSCAVFITGSQTPYESGSWLDWLIGSLTMMVFLANTLETLEKQKDTREALKAAQQESTTRLRKLEHMARHDPLTGLLTRRAFDETVEAMLRYRHRRPAVFLIDLDGFKPINDTYTHEAGDRVLSALGERLGALAGERGIAARFGGDEFAMAFRHIASESDARALGLEIARVASGPVHYLGRALQVGASVGIAQATGRDDSVASLCAGADQAMYRAKGDGGGQAVVYDPAVFRPRASLEDRSTLAEALGRGEIRPHYQPKIDMQTGVVVGFEALARWRQENRRLLMPAEFLPQIAELNLHEELLTQMASAVLRDLGTLLSSGLDPGRVAINVPEMSLATQSGRHDLSALLDHVPEARTPVTFEITEDVFIARAGDVIQASITHFRERGVRISLDDFGTGFASFQHLRQLDFDELKIDSSFVAGLGKDPTADVIVGGFLSIATGLGVTAIAEGVETEEQERELMRMGCRFAQGFRYGRAVPFEAMRAILEPEELRKTGS